MIEKVLWFTANVVAVALIVASLGLLYPFFTR
jgi:hypothetical protein